MSCEREAVKSGWLACTQGWRELASGMETRCAGTEVDYADKTNSGIRTYCGYTAISTMQSASSWFSSLRQEGKCTSNCAMVPSRRRTAVE